MSKSVFVIKRVARALFGYFFATHFDESIEFSRGLFASGLGWSGLVWCGVVRCGVVWGGVVWCGVLCCGMVWSGLVRSCQKCRVLSLYFDLLKTS